MQVFMQDLAGGAFTYPRPSVGELSRAMEVGRRFGDLGLGLVDGSVVGLARVTRHLSSSNARRASLRSRSTSRRSLV